MGDAEAGDKVQLKNAIYDTKAIVTIEDHNIYGGLGSAVAEVLAENTPVNGFVDN